MASVDTSTYSSSGTSSTGNAFYHSTPAYSSRGTSPKHKLHNFLDNPTSSRGAFWYAIFVLVLIFFATVLFLIASIPRYYKYNDEFSIVQNVVGGIFTIDYFLRLATADSWVRWALYPLSILDLLVVIPFIVNLVPSINVESQYFVLRAVRLLVFLKLIKITRYGRMTKLIAHTLRKSKDAFVVLLFGIGVICVFLSTLIYIAENSDAHFNEEREEWLNPDGSLSDFQNIFDAMWWCIVTVTTVGYGDKFPRTVGGKIVGSVTMLIGIMLTAIPIAIFTTNFMDLWREQKHRARLVETAGIISNPVKPKTKHEKEKNLARIMAAIMKEEEVISQSLASAHENLIHASKTHDQLRNLIEELHLRMHEEIEEEPDDPGEKPTGAEGVELQQVSNDEDNKAEDSGVEREEAGGDGEKSGARKGEENEEREEEKDERLMISASLASLSSQ